MAQEFDPTWLHLRWALDESQAERGMRAEILSRLPTTIMDVHSHANGSDAVGTLSASGWRQPRSSFPSWSVAETYTLRSYLFGKARVRSLIMAQPYRGIDHRKANSYLLANVTPPDLVTLCGLPDDIKYTINEIQSGRYAALKMYPHYAEPAYSTVKEYFPFEVVAAAARQHMPLILHLPRPLSQCVDEVIEVAENFLDARIVLAHLGRESEATDQVRWAMRRVSMLPQVAMDCSMAVEPDVHRLALEVFGADRVMYGSDTPMNLLRFCSFRHPRFGYRLMSKHRYHWLDEEMFAEYSHLARNAVLAHWQVLHCLIGAVDQIFGSTTEAVLEQIFSKNAENWFAALQSSPSSQ